MERHRNDFFLAPKTGRRTYREVHDEICKSLERLQVDHVNLLQLHNLTHPDDWDIAMTDGGALEAAIDAQD
jgi:predicted aldo/keto reductase-like oxidoreductase